MTARKKEPRTERVRTHRRDVTETAIERLRLYLATAELNHLLAAQNALTDLVSLHGRNSEARVPLDIELEGVGPIVKRKSKPYSFNPGGAL